LPLPVWPPFSLHLLKEKGEERAPKRESANPKEGGLSEAERGHPKDKLRDRW